jgi:hydroxymethylglutaryl-CoA reductase
MPVKDYEKSIGRPIEDLLTYIELDRQGVLEEIGWPAYTGMGGEIIPAFYRTMKNNPRPDLVSSLQKLYVKTCGDDLFFGIISPMAREALKIAGIRSAKEYAAAMAAITLAGEFNFTALHIQEKMYTGR